MNKADCPPENGWSSCDLVKAWIERKSWIKKEFAPSLPVFRLGHYSPAFRLGLELTPLALLCLLWLKVLGLLSLYNHVSQLYIYASLVAQMVKNPLAIQETQVWSLGWEDSSGEGNGNPLQYSCMVKPMDKGPCQATVHGVAKVRHNWATNTQTHIWKWSESHSAMSDSLWPHGLYSPRSSSEYWSILNLFPSRDFPNPRIESRSLTLKADSLPAEPPGKPPTPQHTHTHTHTYMYIYICVYIYISYWFWFSGEPDTKIIIPYLSHFLRSFILHQYVINCKYMHTHRKIGLIIITIFLGKKLKKNLEVYIFVD